jgi:hypothetical protein
MLLLCWGITFFLPLREAPVAPPKQQPALW